MKKMHIITPYELTDEQRQMIAGLVSGDIKFDVAGQRQSALDTQEGGKHYKKLGAYQPWEVAFAWLSQEELKGAMKFTVMSYLAREADKNGMEDIRKASHTMQLYLELEARREAAASQSDGCGNCSGCSCSGEAVSDPDVMVFDPVTGAAPFPGPYNPEDYRRHHGNVAWLFNPWTGTKRNPLDIGSDPFGHLIAPF